MGVVGVVWGANQLCCPSLANESGTSRAMAGMHILYHNNFLVSPRNSFYSRPKTNILLCNFEDVFSRMKAYQAERKFLYFEKRHFLFLSRMSFLCMRRSDPQERRSRTLKTGIDFKPNSKTFRYILNHNNNKKLRKLCLSRFCACSAIPTCLLSDINPCRISAWDASENCALR